MDNVQLSADCGLGFLLLIKKRIKISDMMKFFNNHLPLFIFSICIILLIIGIFLLWQQSQKWEYLINNTNNYYPFRPLSDRELSNYLKKAFPSGDAFEATFYKNERIFKAKKNNRTIGYAKLIEKDIPCPTCTDVRFICGLDTNGRVKSIVLINEIDLRGVQFKIAKLELFFNQLIKTVSGKQGVFRITLVDEFLKQFYSKPINDNFFQIGKNIGVITGATESSYYMTEGINEFIAIIKNLHQKIT